MPTTPDFETVSGQTLDPLAVTLTKSGVGFDLTGYTAVALVRRLTHNEEAETEIALTPDADQATNPGVATIAATALPATSGDYNVRYRATRTSDGAVEYFPDDGLPKVWRFTKTT